MRIGPDESIWIVKDPTATSEIFDIYFNTTPKEIERMCKGGFLTDRDITIFTDEAGALAEAKERMLAMRIYQAVKKDLQGSPVDLITEVSVGDSEGSVLATWKL